MSLTTTIAICDPTIERQRAFDTLLAIVCEATDGRDPKTVRTNTYGTELQQGLIAAVSTPTEPDGDEEPGTYPPGTIYTIDLTTWGLDGVGRPCKGHMHQKFVRRLAERLETTKLMACIESTGAWVTTTGLWAIGYEWCREECALLVRPTPFLRTDETRPTSTQELGT